MTTDTKSLGFVTKAHFIDNCPIPLYQEIRLRATDRGYISIAEIKEALGTIEDYETYNPELVRACKIYVKRVLEYLSAAHGLTEDYDCTEMLFDAP